LAYGNRFSGFNRRPDSFIGLLKNPLWIVRLILVLFLMLVVFGVIISVFGLAIYGAVHLFLVLHGMTSTAWIGLAAILLILGSLFGIVRLILTLLFWPAFIGATIYGALHLFHGMMSTPLIILATVLLIFASVCFVILG
jgi:hypothetical protein